MTEREVITIEEWDNLPLHEQIQFQPTLNGTHFERWTTLKKLMGRIGDKDDNAKG